MINKILENPFLEAQIQEIYNIPQPIKVKFLRRSFNDHYLITSKDKKYILRVYLNENRNNVTGIMFELDLLDYLYQQRFPVAYPMKNRNGKSLSELRMNNEIKYISLFSFAEGNPIEGLINEEQAYTLGELIAKLHVYSSNFESNHSRGNIDVDYLLIDPIKEIEKIAKSLGINPPSLFSKYINDLIEYFKNFPKDNGLYGLIHGDLNPSNIHFSENKGFTFFDFDHCAFGWRIHDLSLIHLCYPTEIYDAVLEGYKTIRTLQAIEIKSLKSYSDVLLIRKYKDILEMKPFENNVGDKIAFIKNAIVDIQHISEINSF